MRSLVTLLVCLLIIFVAFPSTFNSFIFSSSAKIEKSEEDFLSITDKNNYFELDIGHELSLEDYVVVESRPASKHVKMLGVVKEVAVVPSADYPEFQSIVDSGGCAASFLNSHASTILLVPSDQSNKHALATANLHAGENLHIKARELTVAHAEINGNVVDGWDIQNAHLVMVEELS